MSREPTTPPRPPADEDPGLIDFKGIRNELGFVLRSPLRHRRLAVACLALVLVAAALSPAFIRDVYQVQATLMAQSNPVMLTLSNPGVMRSADWEAPTRAARETIIRRENLVALCEQTGLVERHVANRTWLGRARAWVNQKILGREPSRQELLDSLVDTISNKLWVLVLPDGTVTITFEWPDPQIAYHLVEAAVQNFLETRHATDVAVLGETIALLEANATKLKLEVDTSLSELERKERGRPRPVQRRVVARPAAAAQRDEETVRLESTLATRRRAASELEEFRVRRLAELNAQLLQRQTMYAEQHPEIQTTRQSIAALMQPSPQAESLRLEIKELERQLAKRGGSPADAGDVYTTEIIEPRASADPEEFRADYERSHLRMVREQYTSMLERLSAARLEMETAKAAFKYRYSVISPPLPPKGPKRPYLLLRVLGGLLGGVGLALFACTMADIRSGKLHEEWQVERSLDLPVLGRLDR